MPATREAMRTQLAERAETATAPAPPSSRTSGPARQARPKMLALRCTEAVTRRLKARTTGANTAQIVTGLPPIHRPQGTSTRTWLAVASPRSRLPGPTAPSISAALTQAAQRKGWAARTTPWSTPSQTTSTRRSAPLPRPTIWKTR